MLTAAIVGCGNISNSHIQALLTFPERVRVVALCDIYPEKAEYTRQKYGFTDAVIFDDHEKMLSSGIPIDLVHVCTPPYVHAEIAVNSMNAGCNVLVEKPMATCLEECDAMLEAEVRNQVMMACIAQNRFQNSIYKLKKTADSGLAGRICCAQVDSFWWRGHSYYDLWWRGTWKKEGGGPTLNHAVHHIDMLNWIMGDLPTEAAAMLTNVMHDNSEVEDLSAACLRYADSSMAIVTSSVVHHGEEQKIVLQCADARISAPWSVRAELSQRNGFPIEGGNQKLVDELNAYYAALPDLEYTGHIGEVDDVLSALENHVRPSITRMDGRRTVELITAIYKAGCKKAVVSLPITKDDPYYRFSGILQNAVRFHHKGESVDNFEDEAFSLGKY